MKIERKEKRMTKKAICFQLSGRTAIFRKPDVNTYAYLTYNNIHKPALLGMLGALLGLCGYEQQGDKKFPEYYELLRELKVSILPQSDNDGVFSKKIQVFNNSVGYASKEEGGNLIVREQWLEHPSWLIYIMDDGTEVYNQLKKQILTQQAEFVPYLGKNEHPATIDQVHEVELELVDPEYVDSLVVGEQVDIGYEPYDEDEIPYLFKEKVPVGLVEDVNFYNYEDSIYTNCNYNWTKENVAIYSDQTYRLFFF